MKKIYLGIIISALIIGCTTTGIIYNSNNSNGSDKKVDVQHLAFDFINQKDNLKDVVNDSELIVKGKVSKVTPVEINHLIFTNYTIDVNDVLKGKEQSVVVSLTGGSLNGVSEVSDEIKPLVKGQEYIFCLEKVYPEKVNSNIFSPIGGYQGIFAIEELTKEDSNKSTTGASVNILEDSKIAKATNKIKIKEFNKSNAVEESLEGKELSIEDFK